MSHSAMANVSKISNAPLNKTFMSNAPFITHYVYCTLKSTVLINQAFSTTLLQVH